VNDDDKTKDTSRKLLRRTVEELRQPGVTVSSLAWTFAALIELGRSRGEILQLCKTAYARALEIRKAIGLKERER